jgi:Cohesin domain
MRNIFTIAAIATMTSALGSTVLSVTGQSSITTGQDVLVNVSYSSTTADLYAFQMDLQFPSFLELNTVTEEGYFASNGCCFSAGTVNSTTNTVSLIFDSLSGANPGVLSTPLVGLDFTALMAGSGSVTIPQNEDLVLVDSNGNPLTPNSVNGLNVVVTDSSARQGGGPPPPPSDTPEPASVLLICGGMLCIAGKWKFSKGQGQ